MYRSFDLELILVYNANDGATGTSSRRQFSGDAAMTQEDA